MNHRFSLKQILIIILVGGISTGCSTQKNTLFSRTYHNVTSKFNYLFNAHESFYEAEKKFSNEYPYSYTTLLPIFLFDNSAAPSKTTDGCDRAIIKSGMLIKYHSITAKPKSKKQNTAAQRNFYAQQEFCRYVDDAYFLIGKGNAYQHNYSKARQAFEQIALNYPNSNTYPVAKIWLGLLAGAENDLVQYHESLTSFKTNDNNYIKHRALYNAAWADYYIKKGNLPKAAEYLEQAILAEKNKETKLRYTYLLGQLFQQSNNSLVAQKCFRQVAQKSRIYEMAFNAQIQEAMSFSTGNDPETLKGILLKMAKNQRNAEFLDQIYYAIGKIYLKDGKESAALEYFNKSLSTSTANSTQRGVTFYEIAHLSFANKDFITSQSYYDSASTALSSSHPLFSDASNRSKKLFRLASKTKEYHEYDSLLRLSSLNEADRNRIIEEKIAVLEAQKNKEQQEAIQQRQYQMNQNNLSLGTQQSSSWYFYNQSTLAIGAAEFKMRWGTRKLEDNWRRKNKGNVSELAEAKISEEKAIKDATSPLTKEYYLKSIPKTDLEKQELLKKKLQAQVEVADAYRADILDSDSAISILDEVMKDKPTDEELLLKIYTVYYQAFLTKGEVSQADKYKNIIINSYPKSGIAISIQNSSLSKEPVSQESTKALQQCIDLLKASNYKECLTKANKLLSLNNQALMPQLALIKAMAIGGIDGREAYRRELSEVASKYPTTQVATTANEYIQSLDKKLLSQTDFTPAAKTESKQINSSSKYLVTDGNHEIIVVVPNKTNINQLKFNLTSFNLESYPELTFSITEEVFDSENTIVKIKQFTSKSASVDYYYQLLDKQDIISQAGIKNFALYSISPENSKILMSEKSLKSYSDFFMSNYLK